jgi:hypothetical protein
MARRIACLSVITGVLGLPVAAAIVPVAALAAAATSTTVLPAAGNSGSSPFSPSLPSGPTASTATAAPAISTTGTSGTSSLSGGAAIGIAAGAVIVLGGISFFIWRDARRRAPVRARTAGAGGGLDGAPVSGSRGSKAKPKTRKLSPAERRRRKRGKAR